MVTTHIDLSHAVALATSKSPMTFSSYHSTAKLPRVSKDSTSFRGNDLLTTNVHWLANNW